MAPYYISRLVVAIPLRVIQGLLFGSILYWSAGLNPSATAFVIFCFLIVCEVSLQACAPCVVWCRARGVGMPACRHSQPAGLQAARRSEPHPSLSPPPTHMAPQDLAGQGLGLAVSAAVPHEKVAMALTPMVSGAHAGWLPGWPGSGACGV